ncbi:unnamed protein product [Leptosia nina]|uniref:Uncharacterized protein n=1 Tax=Leptosia nina TaxID=320188 RepID=A0AAV1JNY7_9NEOP
MGTIVKKGICRHYRPSLKTTSRYKQKGRPSAGVSTGATLPSWHTAASAKAAFPPSALFRCFLRRIKQVFPQPNIMN